jgi:hypothetical protein
MVDLSTLLRGNGKGTFPDYLTVKSEENIVGKKGVDFNQGC